jgi:hypothetical protein
MHLLIYRSLVISLFVANFIAKKKLKTNGFTDRKCVLNFIFSVGNMPTELFHCNNSVCIY